MLDLVVKHVELLLDAARYFRIAGLSRGSRFQVVLLVLLLPNVDCGFNGHAKVSLVILADDFECRIAAVTLLNGRCHTLHASKARLHHSFLAAYHVCRVLLCFRGRELVLLDHDLAAFLLHSFRLEHRGRASRVVLDGGGLLCHFFRFSIHFG